MRTIETLYSGELTTASPLRRLSGSLLDGLIQISTLYIGWLIWFVIVVPRGQTPGKALLGMYVMREDGTRAGGGYTLVRELIVKGLLFGIAGLLTAYIATLLGALWCIWDRERQCLWDKVASTYVAYSRSGERPLTNNECRIRGEPTPRDAYLQTMNTGLD